jgi:hypothetical protein
MIETPKKNGLVTINYCVSRFLNEVGNYEPKPNEKKRYTQFAIDCFLDLNIMQPHSVKIAYLKVNEAYNAELPSDFVRHTKIAVNDGGGRFWTLTYDPSMIPATQYKNGELEVVKKQPKFEGIDRLFFSDHFANGNYIAGFYSQPGGFNDAYYNIDRERGVISLSNKIPKCELILEYISTGINTQTDVIVPIEAVPVIVAYIHKIWSHNAPNVPMNKQMQREDAYEREYSKLLTQRTMFTADEYLDMVYSTYHQGVKR